MSGQLRCNRSSCLRAVALLCTLSALASVGSADEMTVRRTVDSGSLGQSPNSVVLEFRLNEGKGTLSTDQHDQLS